jgi:hypothetical protein
MPLLQPFSNYSYTGRRLLLYSLLWIVSVVELSLTAYRIHHTKKAFRVGFYGTNSFPSLGFRPLSGPCSATHRSHFIFFLTDPIVVELLVTSILTILWIPATIAMLVGSRAAVGGTGSASSARHPFFPHELGGNFILWVMWLVGAAIATVRPISYPWTQLFLFCLIFSIASFVSCLQNKWPNRVQTPPGHQGAILRTIVAFAWIPFGLLTLAKVFGAMHHASASSTAGTGSAGYGTEKNAPATANTTQTATATKPTMAPTV